jgi:ABC-type Fe3+-siderophore transport system permease subunit
MTWERLRLLGYIFALAFLGVVVFSLYGLFRPELEKSQYIGFLGGVLLGALLVVFIMVILIVPERRRTAWVQAITTVNAKYLFLVLIIMTHLNIPCGGPSVLEIKGKMSSEF